MTSEPGLVDVKVGPADEIKSAIRVATDGKIRLPASWAQRRLWFLTGWRKRVLPIIFVFR